MKICKRLAQKLWFCLLWFFGVRRGQKKKARPFSQGKLAVLVPAYNEVDILPVTYASLKEQTRPPDRTIVIDDGSDDGTGEVARELGVEVLSFAHRAGSKAKAINKALAVLELEDCDYLAILDADTSLDSKALELAEGYFAEEKIAATCGYVLSGQITTFWQKARAVEYITGGALDKGAQEWWSSPLIMAGCFTVWRAHLLQEAGFPDETVTEDLDLTWQLISRGWRAVYASEARCWTVDPQNFSEFRSQMLRWRRGFIQNIIKHRKNLLKKPQAAFFAFLWLLGGMILTPIYLGLLVWLLITNNWEWLAVLVGGELAYLGCVTTVQCIRLGYTPRVGTYALHYWALRPISIWLFWEAIIKEINSGLGRKREATWSKTRKKGVTEMYNPEAPLVGAVLRIPALAILTVALLAAPQQAADKTDAIKAVEGEPRASITFTFDDGWRSVYENAFPVLEKCGATGTAFVVTGQIGNPAYMTWAQLKEIAKAGWEIGSHAIRHVDLTGLSSEALNKQLAGSKRTLSQHDFNALSFASPHGEYDEETLQAIQSHYDAHRTLDQGINHRPFEAHRIKSFDVNRHNLDDLDQLFELIRETKETEGHLVLTFHHIDEPAEQFSELNYPAWKLEATCLYARELGFRLTSSN